MTTSNKDAVRTMVGTTAKRLAARGFLAYLGGRELSTWCVWRQHGEIRQSMRFAPSWDAQDEYFSTAVYFDFASDGLWAALERHCPGWAAGIVHQRQTRGPSFGNVHVEMNEIFEGVREGLGMDMFARVKARDVERWTQRFNDWLEGEPMRLLDAARDDAGLARLLFAPHRLRRMGTGWWLSNNLVSTIFLLGHAGAAGTDARVWWARVEKELGDMQRRAGDDAGKLVARETTAAYEHFHEKAKTT